MMNLFRRGEATPKSSQNRKNASDRSSVAVAADKIPSKPSSNHHERHLVPPSSLYHSYHAANEDSGLRSDDWALAAPTGVTDDRSDGSPSRMHTDMESTIASQDSFTVDRANQQQQLHAKDWSSPVHSSKNYTGTGQAKIFTPPHGAKTPRSSNQRYSNRANANESAAAAAPYYFFMKDHQTKRKPHKKSNNDESDGILWQDPQSWWTVARNRLGGADSTKDDDLLQPSKPKPSKNTGRTPLYITTTSPERNDQTATNDNASSWTQRLGVFVCSSAIVYMILFVGMAAGLTYGTMNQLRFFSNINWDEQITVAFVGTSYLFVNDIPRLLEVMSGGQVIQDSCLRSGGSLATVLLSGNGMYCRWQTNEALIYSNEEQDDYYSTPDDVTSGSNDSRPLYDYGACSVHQLIAGYDNYLEYGNGNRAYSDDGNNPCLVDENYLRFITTNKYSSSSNVPKWDFVVLADQSKRMAASSGSARYDTTDALVSVYAPLLLQSGSVPVIVDTHAFWSSHSNMTGLQDVPTFAKMIYQGVEEYVSSLSAELPTDQAPIVVPIGLAYLLIWEENYSMWQKLFLSDDMHSSLSGSYLFACVLYTKLFGHLPKRSASLPRHMEYLFAYSRRTIGTDPVYPSTSEAEYLRGVAKRIVLDGVVPRSFVVNDDDGTRSGGNRR